MNKKYDFTNKPNQTKEKFLFNEWSKTRYYKKKYVRYAAYVSNMGDLAILNPETKIWSWK